MMINQKQIGILDINVYLTIEDGDRSTYLEKRWDLEKSPFWKHWIKSKPSELEIFFPYYPHTGDNCCLIPIPSLDLRIDFVTTKTSLESQLISIQGKIRTFYHWKDASKKHIGIAQEKILKAMVEEDGWTRY